MSDVSERNVRNAIAAITAMAWWGDTPQGFQYWSDVQDQLKSLLVTPDEAA